jgi:hypothetical protein
MDTVEVTINGRVEKLVPTLSALEALNKRYDNFQAVYSRIASMDFEAYANVLAAGVEGKIPANDKERKDAMQAVYETGVINLMAPMIEYLGILLNGGKRKEMTEETPVANPKI